TLQCPACGGLEQQQPGPEPTTMHPRRSAFADGELRQDVAVLQRPRLQRGALRAADQYADENPDFHADVYRNGNADTDADTDEHATADGDSPHIHANSLRRRWGELQ